VPARALCLAGILLYAGLRDPSEPEWKQNLRTRADEIGTDVRYYGPADDPPRRSGDRDDRF
jgi:hypothetical protein